jgi:hypothetical protein
METLKGKPAHNSGSYVKHIKLSTTLSNGLYVGYFSIIEFGSKGLLEKLATTFCPPKA